MLVKFLSTMLIKFYKEMPLDQKKYFSQVILNVNWT